MALGTSKFLIRTQNRAEKAKPTSSAPNVMGDTTATVAGFPATNAISGDRSLRAVWPGAGGQITIDLGGNQTVNMVGFSGFAAVGDEDETLPTSVACYGSTTYPFVHGAPNLLATIPHTGLRNRRDSLVMVVPSSKRYIRWVWAFSPRPMSFAAFVAGNADDLGIGFSVGSAEQERLARVQTRTASKARHDTVVGPPSYGIDHVYSSVVRAEFDILRNFAALGGYMLSASGESYFATLEDDSFDVVPLWGNPEVYEVNLRMEGLP